MINLGDIGTVIEITIVEEAAIGQLEALDISDAASKRILFQHADTSLIVDADFSTDGTDGKIEYTLVEGDIDAAGRWLIQACIVTPAGTFHTGVAAFDVAELLSGWSA